MQTSKYHHILFWIPLKYTYFLNELNDFFEYGQSEPFEFQKKSIYWNEIWRKYYGFFCVQKTFATKKALWRKKRFMEKRNNSYEINDCRKYFFCFQTHSILIVLFILRKICKPNEKLIMSMHYRLETVKNDINLPDFFF